MDPLMMRLPVELSDEEVQTRAQEAAELMLELDVAEEVEADRKRAWKAEQEAKKRKLRSLSQAVRERAESRPVECDEVPCAGRATMEIYRRDTGALVYSRPMTDGEMRQANQASLWDEASPPTIKVSMPEVEDERQ